MTSRPRLLHECKTYVFSGEKLTPDEAESLKDANQTRELWRVHMHGDGTCELFRNNAHVSSGITDSRSVSRARELVQVQMEKRDAAKRDAERRESESASGVNHDAA